MDTTDPSPNDLQALEGKISLLTELTTRIESLRQTPAYLRPTAGAASAATIPSGVSSSAQAALVRQGFEKIKEFSEKVHSDGVQDVLKAVRESEAKDKSDLTFIHRRRNLKRQWVLPLNGAPAAG